VTHLKTLFGFHVPIRKKTNKWVDGFCTLLVDFKKKLFYSIKKLKYNLVWTFFVNGH